MDSAIEYAKTQGPWAVAFLCVGIFIYKVAMSMKPHVENLFTAHLNLIQWLRGAGDKLVSQQESQTLLMSDQAKKQQALSDVQKKHGQKLDILGRRIDEIHTAVKATKSNPNIDTGDSGVIQ